MPLDLEGIQPVTGPNDEVHLGLRPRSPEEQFAFATTKQVVPCHFGDDPVLPQCADVGARLLGRKCVKQGVVDPGVSEEDLLGLGDLFARVRAKR